MTRRISLFHRKGSLIVQTKVVWVSGGFAVIYLIRRDFVFYLTLFLAQNIRTCVCVNVDENHKKRQFVDFYSFKESLKRNPLLISFKDKLGFFIFLIRFNWILNILNPFWSTVTVTKWQHEHIQEKQESIVFKWKLSKQ